MYKGIPYANKIIKRREQERLQGIHKQNLRNMRPLTTNIDVPFQAVANPFVNNKKKQFLQEDRFTQIERQNRMLLEKIHTIMSKKPTFKQEKLKRNNSINNDKQRMNKSLNQVYRKKQLGDIEIQNAKLLKRIMDKKSDYDSKKLKEEWKKQKKVIKNIANYPFIIRDRIYKGRKKSMTSHSFKQPYVTSNIQQQETTLSSPIQLVRIRNLSGHNFLITVKYDGAILQILGDNKSTKEIKIIEIPKQQGLEFIQYECDGNIEQIFECLRYDPNQKVLYLVGKEVDLENVDQEENQEEKFNTDSGIADKKSLEKEQKQDEKGLKKREMSNIYEIQNSQLEIQSYKQAENNMNKPNQNEVNELPQKNKSQIQVTGQNDNKGVKDQTSLVQKAKQQQNNNQSNINSEAPSNDMRKPQKSQNHANVQTSEKNLPSQIKKPDLPVQNQQINQQQIKKQQKAPEATPNQQPNQPQRKVEKQESQQICGIKSEFELTSMLEKAIG